MVSIRSYSSTLFDRCAQLVRMISNETMMNSDENESFPIYMRQLILKRNLTKHRPQTMNDCFDLLRPNGSDSFHSDFSLSSTDPDRYFSEEHSSSLIIFLTLITLVSFISVLGNLSLAKVLFSKRDRLIQTDRIVLCLALSELCLVLIDTPIEIYRFLSYSFTIDWLCRFHTFFESLFSACIIFYHLLGAFDRFVYIHGHTSNHSRCSKLCHWLSTRSGSMILLFIPLICSLPISVCNSLHANIIYTTSKHKICLVQYNHTLLITLLVSFYLIPLIFSFILHGKLIYLIRQRHHHWDLDQNASPIPLETLHRSDREEINPLEESIKSRGNPLIDHHLCGTPSTTTTLPIGIVPPIISSSRSRTGVNPSSVTTYQINSQANANANRAVLLLVLLLSFYVFCWAPYNIYTWYHAYQLTHRSQLAHSSTMIRTTTTTMRMRSVSSSNLHSDLRRIILMNYSLYLLSMVSMCFSFIFYYSLNKQGRKEFHRCLSQICPKIRYSDHRLNSVRVRNRAHPYDQILRSVYPPRPYDRQRIHSRTLNNYDRSHPRYQQTIEFNQKRLFSSRNYQFQLQCCP